MSDQCEEISGRVKKTFFFLPERGEWGIVVRKKRYRDSSRRRTRYSENKRLTRSCSEV